MNLIGNVYNDLTVIKFAGKDSYNVSIWTCRCVCGNVLDVKSNNLKTNNTKSCGCRKKRTAINQVHNLKDRTFGDLKVLMRSFSNPSKKGAIWTCICKCKNIVDVSTTNLNSGNNVSCGKCNRQQHNLTGSKEHSTWMWMKTRCKNYKNYKDREVYSGWINDFTSFLNHIGPCPEPHSKYSIERIDNEIGYMPGNVKWGTDKEQARNTRRNVYYNIGNLRLCIGEIAEILETSYDALYGRLKNHSLEYACLHKLSNGTFPNIKNLNDKLDNNNKISKDLLLKYNYPNNIILEMFNV